MPTKTQLDQKQMPLDLFPDETAVQLSPNQERELDRALADLLLQHGNAGKTGGER